MRVLMAVGLMGPGEIGVLGRLEMERDGRDEA